MINDFILGDQVVMTSCFWGSEPTSMEIDVETVSVCHAEVETSLAFINSLTADQQASRSPRARALTRLPRTTASPRGALRIAGSVLPARTRRAYERFRYGPAAFQLALAVEEGMSPTSCATPRRSSGTGAFLDTVAGCRNGHVVTLYVVGETRSLR